MLRIGTSRFTSYTQIFQELYYQADFHCGGRLPVHVTFMLDEFANVEGKPGICRNNNRAHCIACPTHTFVILLDSRMRRTKWGRFL